jgi:hypothetical protein
MLKLPPTDYLALVVVVFFLSGFLSFCSWLYQRKNYFESFIADIGKLLETKQCIALTISFVYRNTSKKKACTAMVSVRQNANDNFNNPREATVEVFENIRTIEITYTPGTLIDRSGFMKSKTLLALVLSNLYYNWRARKKSN